MLIRNWYQGEKAVQRTNKKKLIMEYWNTGRICFKMIYLLNKINGLREIDEKRKDLQCLKIKT
jgi:hypothetical protein